MVLEKTFYRLEYKIDGASFVETSEGLQAAEDRARQLVVSGIADGNVYVFDGDGMAFVIEG